MKKIFVLYFVIAMIIANHTLVVFAETQDENSGVYSTQGLSDISVNNEQNNRDRLSGKVEDLEITPENLSTGGLPNVHIGQVKKYAERKLYELIGLLQSLGHPVAIAIFLLCAFLALLGAFGSSSLVFKGIVGMAIAVAIYAVILAAPELLDLGVNWLHS